MHVNYQELHNPVDEASHADYNGIVRDLTMKRTKSFAFAFAVFLAIAGPRLSGFLDIRSVTCISAALILVTLTSLADELSARP